MKPPRWLNYPFMLFAASICWSTNVTSSLHLWVNCPIFLRCHIETMLLHSNCALSFVSNETFLFLFLVLLIFWIITHMNLRISVLNFPSCFITLPRYVNCTLCVWRLQIRHWYFEFFSYWQPHILSLQLMVSAFFTWDHINRSSDINKSQ